MKVAILAVDGVSVSLALLLEVSGRWQRGDHKRGISPPQVPRADQHGTYAQIHGVTSGGGDRQ